MGILPQAHGVLSHGVVNSQSRGRQDPNLPHECCCNAGHLQPHSVRDEQAGCDEVCAGRPHGFVAIRHLHDEAAMRLRSTLSIPAAASAASASGGKAGPQPSAAAVPLPAATAASVAENQAVPHAAVSAASVPTVLAASQPAVLLLAASTAPSPRAKAFPEPAAPAAPLSAPTRTGRYSKIQNSVVILHHSAGVDNPFPIAV